MKDKDISRVAIYPAIGIARIGNSPEFFLASEVPGQAPDPEGGFKDGNNLFKKQVPRFRIYALDENGNALSEITANDATIEWRVHVANRKACWYQFNNAMDLGDKSIPSTKRNGGILGSKRDQLTIDPGARTISGKNKSGPEFQFDTGSFFDKKIWLGEIRTDDKGHLLFFGGNGVSESVTGVPAITFANNDGWHDDVCDGTVRAKVTIGKKTFEADPAMVVCTPPNFGPGLFPVVSMYDVAYDMYIQSQRIPKKPQLNFYEDIYPILYRLTSTQWVNQGFFMLFGTNSPSDFSNAAYLKALSDPSSKHKEDRMRVFEWFRSLGSTQYEPAKLPPHYGDLFADYLEMAHTDLSITNTQYEWMQQWAEGNFVTGKPVEPVPFEKMDVQQQVQALLRAPLEECLGGPFHPGIEITWPFRQPAMWSDELFRLKVLPENTPVKDDYGPMLTTAIALGAGGPVDGSGPGSLTRWLGVPWQTDEASCLAGYDVTLYLPLPSFWSVRVPNTVLAMDSFERITQASINEGQQLKHFAYRVDWLRDFTTDYVTRINRMVKYWHRLGVIAKHEAKIKSPFLPSEWWVETQRKGPKGEDPTLKQVKLAEHDPIKKIKNLKASHGVTLEVGVRDEGVPRESRPLRRHEL